MLATFTLLCFYTNKIGYVHHFDAQAGAFPFFKKQAYAQMSTFLGSTVDRWFVLSFNSN
jgi:hypothetical protein